MVVTGTKLHVRNVLYKTFDESVLHSYKGVCFVSWDQHAELHW